MNPSTELFGPIIALLAEKRVNAVVIGGAAAIALGVAYTTRDVDICYDVGRENIERLIEALHAVNARLRVARMSDDEARKLPLLLDVQLFRNNQMLTLQTDLGPLDLLRDVPGIGGYEAVMAASAEVEAFGMRFWALDLPGLIVNKTATARAKDIAALPLIEAALRERELQQFES